MKELHDDKMGAVHELAIIKYFDQSRVVNDVDGAGLVQEALGVDFILHIPGVHDLDGGPTFDSQVLRFIDDPHSTIAQLAHHPEIAELHPYQRVVWGVGVRGWATSAGSLARIVDLPAA